MRRLDRLLHSFFEQYRAQMTVPFKGLPIFRVTGMIGW
jgi:hypothetical protein